tara:strand:+ start:1764 stop:2486 length:723 start_codon:yes stop_codon:yes gene_type:complete
MSFNINFLKKNKYSFFENIGKYTAHLDNVYKLIDEIWENPTPMITRATKDGYTIYEGPSLSNILYVPEFKDEHIDSVKEFMVCSGAKENIENLWNSNIGICNIRAYRFTNKPPREKSHYLDSLDKNQNIQPHFDTLLPDTLKIMIFKSRDGDFLTLGHGVIEVKPKEKWIPATGKSPVAIIFPPNIVLHRAFSPSEGKIRDCIELTVIKRTRDDFLVESSGAHAGYPLDMVLWNNKTINN